MSDPSLPNYNMGNQDQKDQKDKDEKIPDELNESMDSLSPQESLESSLSSTSPGSSNSDTSAKDTTLFSEDGSPPFKLRRGLKLQPKRMTDADYSAIVEMMCDIKVGDTLNLGNDSDEDEQDDETEKPKETDNTDQNEAHDDPADQNEESDDDITFDSISDLASQDQIMDTSENDNKKRVALQIVTNHRIVHTFQVNMTTRMGKLMGAYSLYLGIPLDHFQFFYRGKPVHKNDTPITLALDWGDFIDSQTEQDYPHGDSKDQDQD
ncbi:coiled-coil domain-containing protein 1-like [Drosophila bipectinata]|uniref:coiled-coil domain-containing protein 1-like n=1 Tax=Drosophila bipectinata TaxID=42026 RepID=UPI0038B34DDE